MKFVIGMLVGWSIMAGVASLQNPSDKTTECQSGTNIFNRKKWSCTPEEAAALDLSRQHHEPPSEPPSAHTAQPARPMARPRQRQRKPTAPRGGFLISQRFKNDRIFDTR